MIKIFEKKLNNLLTNNSLLCYDKNWDIGSVPKKYRRCK